jgi:hypothetical protein
MAQIKTNLQYGTTGTVQSASVADDAITLAKMAVGTDGNIISYDASTNPVAIATGSNGQVLTSTGAGSPPAFEAIPASGANTPYFHVYKNADQVIANASFVTVTFETEQYDSGGNFASNTFTAPSAGYYFIYSQLVWSGGTDSNYSLNRLMKNGSPINWVSFVQDSSNGAFGGRVISLSSTDTVTVQCYQQSGGNLSLRGSSEDECHFGGYKLIT